MVKEVWWGDYRWDEPMMPAPDSILPHVEQLFRACRNISRVVLARLEAHHLPRVLDALRASASRSTLSCVEIEGHYEPADLRLTEADLQLFLLSFPSLTSFSIDFLVSPSSLASSKLLNLRKFQFLAYPSDDEPHKPYPHKPYQSLLHSINPHTMREFVTLCMSHHDWLCHPGFTLDTIHLFITPVTAPVLLPQLTRLLPFHPGLRHLFLIPYYECYTPCEDSADLAALRQIFAILPPTLRSLDLPFAIDLKTIPIQQLISDNRQQGGVKGDPASSFPRDGLN
ncbi:hypothetical protein JCM5296_006163 [Sporobolomyces johnsonii]